MKKLMLVLLICLLTACSVEDQQIKEGLSQEFKTMSQVEPITYTTMSKPLFAYYLPKDVGRIDSNPLSSLLIKDGVQFIMNFNPNRIVIHDFYRKSMEMEYQNPEVTENEHYYEVKGTFKGNDGKFHEYSASIIELDRDDYFLQLDMGYVNFTSVMKKVQLRPLIHSMMVIGKSIQYDSDEVVSTYSLKYSSDSITKDLEKFEGILPDEGSLSDLIDEEESK